MASPGEAAAPSPPARPAPLHLFPSPWRTFLWYLLCAVTLGVAPLLSSRWPAPRAAVLRRAARVRWDDVAAEIDWTRAELDRARRAQLAEGRSGRAAQDNAPAAEDDSALTAVEHIDVVDFDRNAWESLRFDDAALGGDAKRAALLGFLLAPYPGGPDREVPIHLLLLPRQDSAPPGSPPQLRFAPCYAYEAGGALFVKDALSEAGFAPYPSILASPPSSDTSYVEGFDALPAPALGAASAPDLANGLAPDAALHRLVLGGPSPPTVPRAAFLTLLFANAVRPMYLFQVFSTAVWLVEGYWSFAAVILLIATAGLVWESRTELDNHRRVEKIAQGRGEGGGDAEVLRGGRWTLVPQAALVPGDVIKLAPLVGRQVDAELLMVHGEGHAQGTCIVDEAGVTGEPAPAAKTSIAVPAGGDATRSSALKPHLDNPPRASTIHSGSIVMQASPTSTALVAATGRATPLSRLVLSLLHPASSTSKIARQALVFLLILTLVGIAFVAKRIYQGLLVHSNPPWVVVLTSLDVLTLAVPPALPIVLTLATTLSLRRLAALGIWGAEGGRIPDAGRVATVCFDKTGTLTGHQAECVSVVPAGEAAGDLPLAMAVAHEAVALEGSGKLVGPELDLAMLRRAGVSVGPPRKTPELDAIGAESLCTVGDGAADVLLRAPFDAAAGFSAAVARTADGRLVAAYKGSPDAVRALCSQGSVPEDFDEVVRREGRRGGYLIALAVLPLDRFDPAIDLAGRGRALFSGFLVFSNPPHPSSLPTVSHLARAGIRTLIVTGDGPWTALAVARQVGVLPPRAPALVVDLENGEVVARPAGDEERAFAGAEADRAVGEGGETVVTGAVLDHLATTGKYPAMLRKLVEGSRVHARMKPLHKSFLVEHLKLVRPDGAVMFVGDGHNDSGALRAAHVGLSVGAGGALVAPFASADPEGGVADVERLIREGRAALETATSAVKFMVMYPVIQLTIVMYLQHLRGNLSSNQYFIDDLLLVFLIQLPLLALPPTKGPLSVRRPADSLFSLAVLASLCGQVLIWLACFFLAIASLNRQPWYCPLDTAISMLDTTTLLPLNPNLPPSQNFPCYPIDPSDRHSVAWGFVLTSFENTVAWLFGHGQFFVCALAFGISSRFREPLWRNWWYLAYLAGCFGWIVGLALTSEYNLPSAYAFWTAVFGLVQGVTMGFRTGLVVLFILDLVLCVWFWEYLVVGKWLAGAALKAKPGAGGAAGYAALLQAEEIAMADKPLPEIAGGYGDGDVRDAEVVAGNGAAGPSGYARLAVEADPEAADGDEVALEIGTATPELGPGEIRTSLNSGRGSVEV